MGHQSMGLGDRIQEDQTMTGFCTGFIFLHPWTGHEFFEWLHQTNHSINVVPFPAAFYSVKWPCMTIGFL